MPQKLSLKPGTEKQELDFTNFVAQGTTYEQLVSILSTYTTTVIQPISIVGTLVPDLDWLGAHINQNWNFPDGYEYHSGDIDPTWTVQRLASDIDAGLAA